MRSSFDNSIVVLICIFLIKSLRNFTPVDVFKHLKCILTIIMNTDKKGTRANTFSKKKKKNNRQ